jgi:ABC-type phosphate transport system substrate-binding protein
MKRSLLVAAFLAVSGGAVGVSAGNPAAFKGSDTLFDFTNAVIAACPGTQLGPVGGTVVPLVYQGTGSGNGEKAMLAGTQQVAPMSRFMTKNVCTGTANSPTTSQGFVVGLDGVSIVGSKSTFANTACNGDANSSCDKTFETTTGLGYNVADPTTGYVYADWRDVLRVLLAGFDHTNNGTAASNIAARDCNSAERQSLANHYGNIFENNCAAPAGEATATNCGGNCAQIRHIFRRDDFSGTTDTIVSLLNLPSVVNPETTVSQFPAPPAAAGPAASVVQHTGYNPFCNAVRPAFALPQTGKCTDGTACTLGGAACDDASACTGNETADPANVGCLAPGDATYDPTSVNKGTKVGGTCTLENAVFRSTMQDNDPIRRLCCGAGNGPAGTFAEDVCAHTNDLGLVLVMNDQPEAAPNTNANRYNATQCGKIFRPIPGAQMEVYDAVSQGKQICLRGLRCPNGDACTGPGACNFPATAAGSVQCLASKLNAPNAASTVAVPYVHPVAPGIGEGRVYNQHLVTDVSSTGQPGYQTNGFTTPLASMGAFYRIHADHSENPSSTTTAPITCQFADMTDQIGCLVSASPCSIGYAGRGATNQNPNTDALKVNAQNPVETCITGDGTPANPGPLNIAGFTYPLSRKLYLSTVPGFAAVTGNEQSLVGCETNLAQTAAGTSPLLNADSNGGIVSTAIVNAGFIALPSFVNSSNPYCEDFNENMLCSPSATTPLFPTNSQSCPSSVPAAYSAFPTANATTCGNGIQDPYEDCDCGTAQVAASSPAANVTACGTTINGGTVCTTTCRNVH